MLKVDWLYGDDLEKNRKYSKIAKNGDYSLNLITTLIF